MRCLVVFAILVACSQAATVSNIAQKLIPSFSTGFVIKGQEAAPHSAPYIVSLSRSAKHRHDCGGTIIAKDWILTAAHCIGNPVNMSVVAGLHEYFKLDNRTQTRIVDWGVRHKNFSNNTGPYDIAILHLSKPLQFNQYVQPAALPVIEEYHSGKSSLYGWGQPKFYNFAPAKTLQTVETEVMELDDCKKVLPKNANVHETNLCTDTLGKGISACNGDSGGPLVIESDGAPAELIGIVSWGYLPCGVSKMPSIYTRVSSYIDWIVSAQSNYYNNSK